MSQKQRHTTCWGFDTHGVNPDSLTESDVDDKLFKRKSTQDMKWASDRARSVSDAGLRIKRLQVYILIIIIINPLTARVVGTPQMI